MLTRTQTVLSFIFSVLLSYALFLYLEAEGLKIAIALSMFCLPFSFALCFAAIVIYKLIYSKLSSDPYSDVNIQKSSSKLVHRGYVLYFSERCFPLTFYHLYNVSVDKSVLCLESAQLMWESIYVIIFVGDTYTVARIDKSAIDRIEAYFGKQLFFESYIHPALLKELAKQLDLYVCPIAEELAYGRYKAEMDKQSRIYL